MNNDILVKLAAPFHPSRIIWKPQAIKGDKTKALAVAYADPRAYMNRLDEVCGMDWAVSYTPWGERIICHLTINGMTRSSTGESDSDSERSEIAGTAAESQAFKRACAMFGLGRYLYSLPSSWVDYDANAKTFTAQAKARLQALITQHYQRYMSGQPTPEDELPAAELDAGGPDDATAKLRELLEEAGVELYGDKWPGVREHNLRRLGVTDEKLNADNLQTMINGLRKLKSQRQPA